MSSGPWKKREPVKTRLMRKVVVAQSGCWEWTGTIIPEGYGQIKVDGKMKRVHRVAWELFVGLVPPHVLVCHRCDNRRCLRPDHLFLGTYQDNARDCSAKGRTRNGTRRGEEARSSKLTANAVVAIRAARVAGLGVTPLSRRFGVSRDCIYAVINRETWAHVAEASDAT